MTEPLTYTAATVVKVTGIPHNTLNAWIARDLMPTESDAPGAGRARRYDLIDITALAIMRHLTAFMGMRPEQARIVAKLCLPPIGRIIGKEVKEGIYVMISYGAAAEDVNVDFAIGGDQLNAKSWKWISTPTGPVLVVVDVAKIFLRLLRTLQDAGLLENGDD